MPSRRERNRKKEELREKIWFRSCRSSPPEVFIRKGALEIYSKFTGEYPWFATLLKSHFGMVFSSKLAAYFQNTFSKEHLWRAAFGWSRKKWTPSMLFFRWNYLLLFFISMFKSKKLLMLQCRVPKVAYDFPVPLTYKLVAYTPYSL